MDVTEFNWKLRKERADAIQKEQANEAFAGQWIRVDLIESIMVGLAGTCQGILAGIPDAARSCGAPPDLVAKVAAIIAEAQTQISQQMDPVAMLALDTVDSIESTEPDQPPLIAGPKERKRGLRKPRGLGKMGAR